MEGRWRVLGRMEKSEYGKLTLAIKGQSSADTLLTLTLWHSALMVEPLPVAVMMELSSFGTLIQLESHINKTILADWFDGWVEQCKTTYRANIHIFSNLYHF